MTPREKQLAYSEFQPLMTDEATRRTKAAKIASVIGHFRGSEDFTGLAIADVGCSVGFVADELRRRGGNVTGVDIDVPGLARAHERFGAGILFLCADGEALPWADDSLDVIVFNHIYEHVLDPDAVIAELRRVLKPDGVLYLGLGNRLGVMEPHYRLPFLSYLAPALADRYVRAFGRADRYHERFRTWAGLRKLARNLYVHDYTYAVLSSPDVFHAGDVVKGPVSKLPLPMLKALRPVVPTYIWVATKSPSTPAGPALRVPPAPVAT